MAGLITITMPYTMYTGSVTNSNAFEFRDYPIYEPETEDSKGKQARHLEPIFGMLCKLHRALSALLTRCSNAHFHQ